MSKHRVSTTGCKSIWNQRGPRQKRKPDDSDDDIGEFLIGEVSKAVPKARPGLINVYRDRPNDDGIVHRATAVRKRNRPLSTKRRDPTPVIVDHNTIHDHVHAASSSSGDPSKDLEDFMEDLLEIGENTASEWQNRQEEVNSSWENCRPSMMARVVEAHAVMDDDNIYDCFVCRKVKAAIRCIDCMGSFLCSDCDSTIHAVNPLHDRQTWSNGYYQFLPQEYEFPLNMHYACRCSKCNSTELVDVDDGKYIAITTKGRFDVPKTKKICSRCKTDNRHVDLSNLIQRGFWPANPDLKSQYVFEGKVLYLWHMVAMNLPGSSLSGFINALGDISEKYGRKRTINHTVFTRVLAEHSYMEEELLLLKNQNSMKCPPCSIEQLMGHVDGNHKVYRYNKNMSCSREAYHMDRFIVEDNKVKDHVINVYSKHPSKNTLQDIYCGTSKWKAAREVKCKNDSLDETGLVVAGCRHAVAQKAVNMFQGELYAYSHYLHVFYMLENGVQFFWQDVVCKYWPWAKKVATSSPVWQRAVVAMRPALSVMHARGHSWHCQICWSGRYVEGAGAGSGEDMEQFFSHLSRTGNTTKYMTKAGRVDTLTNHTLFWNRRKIRTIPVLLCSRYQRMKLTMEQTEMDLMVITQTVPADKRPAVLEQWKDEVIKTARDAGQPIRLKHQHRDLQEYFIKKQQLKEASLLQAFVDTYKDSVGLSSLVGSDNLYKLAKDRTQNAIALANDVKMYEDKYPGDFTRARVATYEAVTRSLQKEVEATVGSRHQRKQAMKIVAGSSKQRSRLAAKNEKDKIRVKALMQKLTELQLLMANNVAYDIDKILEGQFPWKVEESTDWTTKKRAIDLHMLQKRLQEEEPLLKKEMTNYLKFFVQNKEALKEELSKLKDVVTKLESEDTNIMDTISEANMDTISAANMEVESNRYLVSDDTKLLSVAVVKGLCCVKEEGLNEANMNINWALTCFKKILTTNGWRSMLIDTEGEMDDEVDVDDEVDEEDHEELILTES